MYRVTYTNPYASIRKRRQTHRMPWEKAQESAGFLRQQGAKRVKIVEDS